MVMHVDVDVQQLWRDYRAEPTVEMRNQLVELYLPLVKYNAERIWSRLPEGVELDDLISAGVFGLMDAIEAFDLERGVKFETYCVPRIRGAMLDELRTMDWVPRLVRSKASKLEEARRTQWDEATAYFTQALDAHRIVGNEEGLAGALGLPAARQIRN